MIIEKLYQQIENGEITLEEINSMDVSGLFFEEKHLDSRISYYDTYQQALKISMNALYGALANVHFLLFNRDVAASITGNGRIFIQGLANYINGKLQKVLGSNVDFVVYGDTDSVVGDTYIYSDVFGKIRIKDYFNHSEGFVEERSPIDLTKYLDFFDKTYSVSKDGVLRKNRVKYVMKHRVKKRFFKITIDGKSVTVTEDHSVLVKRDDKIIELKPTEIKNSDFLIKLI